MKNLKLLTKKRLRLLALLLCMAASIPQLWADDFYMLSSATTWSRDNLLNDAYKMTESNGEWTWSFTPTSNGDFFFRIVGRWSGGWYNDDIAASYDQKPVTLTYQDCAWNLNYAWKLTVTAGNTYTIYKNSSHQVKYSVSTPTPTTPDYYLTGSAELGLGGFSYQQQNLIMMTHDATNDVYTYSYNVTTAGTYYFAFADGGGSSWDDFNGNHRYGPASGDEAVTLNGDWAATQRGHGSYAVTLDAGQVTITFDATNMRYKVAGTPLVIPTYYYAKGEDTNIFPDGWSTNSNTTQMTDNGSGIYSWTSSQFHLNAGTNYLYRVYVSDGSWIPSSGNQTFSSNVPGNYTVTVSYNSNNGTVNAELNLIQADPTYTYDIYVRYTGSEPIGNVFIYSWDNTGNLSGPWSGSTGGTSLSSLNSQEINGYTYYHVTYTSYASTINAIFNENGSNQTQTSDLSVQPGTSYFTYGGGTSVTGPNPEPDAEIVVNYYVIGGNTALWPGGWSTTDIPASQQMTNNDGTYTWAVENVHLDFGDFGFKVYDSNAVYHPSGPDNVQVEVSAPGTYNLTITFDPSNSDDMPVVTLTPVTLDPLTYSVIGSAALFGGDDWANAQAMADDGDNTYSWDSGNMQLTAGTYSFKVKDNMGHWFGTAGSDNGDNIEVVIPADGTYTLHIDFDGSNAPTYQLRRIDIPTMYITGDLGSGWSPMPTAMTYDSTTGLYSYHYNVINPGTFGFVFADGQGDNADDWDNFNNNYRIGPTDGNVTVTLNGDWTRTQHSQGDHGSYLVTLGVGNYTIYYDPTNMKFRVVGSEPVYITGDLGLGLGWTYNPTTAMTYDDATGTYKYTYRVPKQGTYGFVFATGQVTGIDDQGQAWNTFNSNYRIGPTSGDQTVTLNGDWADTQFAGGDHGSYQVTLPAGNVTIILDKSSNPMRFKVISDQQLGYELYMVGGLTYENEIHHYAPNDGILMKYDNAKKLYYLNHVTLNTNSTFCFSHELGSDDQDWPGMGTRYGNDDTNEHYFVPREGDIAAHLKVTGDKIDVNMPLGEWDDDKGEWMMYTAGIYNVVVNLEDGWVKLIKTDHFSLFPMNVYLEKTDNVEIGNVGESGTVYSAEQFTGNWPLIAWNRTDVQEGQTEGTWDPHGNHYSVTYIGDTITADGKQWWHWQVSASIAEVVFTRTNQTPNQSPTIARKSGVLWYTWEEDNTMTDHSREYFTSSATSLPGNVVVEEGHYYVYFINTVGWETVYCYAWDGPTSPYIDGHGKNLESWPGQVMTCVGIDPMTGYEVWEYDFGAIDDSNAPGSLLFHDGTPVATTDAKEQTGDFVYVNGGVYDYLGLFDDAYTLNSLIRTAKKKIRYTISNDLLGVYYDPDAKTPVTYPNSSGTNVTETVTGALYAKDLNDYGEKSVMPDGDEFTDYVYDICGTWGTDGSRPSQIMDKRTEYDQSNWIKLVVSPNYDGATNLPNVPKPDLSQYVNRIIPGKTLQLYMTDSINPTARVMAIQMGDEMTYEPNVYISSHFNDTVVFNYTHREWQPYPYAGNYRTQPFITWHENDEGGNIYATVERVRVDDNPYKMFYVAPKPQEIAYITWVVYDNYNIPNSEDIPPYGNYESGVYTPYTPEGRFLPEDPGRFYAPRNFDRSETISLEYLEGLVDKGIITQDQLDELRVGGYLSEDQLNTIWGGYGQQYGPYTNGYMQYGAIKVNWSLFDINKSGGEAWWQIFRPGQAYKFKAIIRYARGSVGKDSADNYYYEPSSGEGNDGTILSGPRRVGENDNTYYPNLYFTGDYKDEDLTSSKFIIFPIEASSGISNGTGMGNVTTVREVIQDVTAPRTILSVRYFNLMGVESDKPFDGINIVVTTYSDGSRTSKKILR